MTNRSERPPRRLSPAKRLLFGALVAATLLVGLELAVRAAARVDRTLAYGSYNWIVDRIVSLDDPDTPWISDPDLLWRLRPHAFMGMGWRMGYPGQDVVAAFDLNELGLRDGPVTPRPAGVRRVVHLGDSCTFGLGVPNDETYADRLPALLAERGAGAWDSLNAGVLSYSSFQGRRLIERHVDDFRPDVVTVYFGWNDSLDMSPDAQNRISKDDLRGRATRALYRSEAFKLARSALFFRIRPELNTVRVSPDEYEANLRAVVDLGRTHGFEVILLTGPAGPHMETGEPAHEPANRAYVERTRRVAEQTGAGLVDAAASFPADGGGLFHDPIHPNSAGHARIADALADALVEAAASRPHAAGRSAQPS